MNPLRAKLLLCSMAGVLLGLACSGGEGRRSPVDAAGTAAGGSAPQTTGGLLGSGGVVATGGVGGSGGSIATEGTASTSLVVNTGGGPVGGGTLSTGGTASTGGVQSTGGAGAGGTSVTGGTSASGGTGGKIGTGGVLDAGSPPTDGAKADAASTAGCQCELETGSMLIPWNCYCAAYRVDCDLNYVAFRGDAGTAPWYSGISEYSGCNLAVVYRSDSWEMSYRYFNLTTGELVGLHRTVNGGFTCPFALDAGSTVFNLDAGNTNIPTGCARSACQAGPNQPRFCDL